jgi:hypothetical protein
MTEAMWRFKIKAERARVDMMASNETFACRGGSTHRVY